MKKMIIWDIHPGYLSDTLLLEEYESIRYLLNISKDISSSENITEDFLRWSNFKEALSMRARITYSELEYRNFKNKEISSFPISPSKIIWPQDYIYTPSQQFNILDFYKIKGRIELPKTPQELWKQHKYSIMSRDTELYKEIGKMVSNDFSSKLFDELSLSLVDNLRKIPSKGRIRNTLQHMWGYISKYSSKDRTGIDCWDLEILLKEIQFCTKTSKETYLSSSTSLTELGAWF